jgi:hypothetical protein
VSIICMAIVTMPELRVQTGRRPLQVFYAFDSRRSAILLIGGDKTVTIASTSGWCLSLTTYDTYIEEVRKEGLIP